MGEKANNMRNKKEVSDLLKHSFHHLRKVALMPSKNIQQVLRVLKNNVRKRI